MLIALLLDGEPNPISIQVDTVSKFIAHPRGGVVANFEHMPGLSDEKVAIYKRKGCELSSEEFESLAYKEADPYRRPKTYRHIQRDTVHGIAA